MFEAAYVFGAVCPAEGKVAGLIMPKANSEGMQKHLDIIAGAVAWPDKHAVLVVDRAAWHVTAKLQVPPNLSILPLPPYSPELNPVKQKYGSSYGVQIGQTDASKTMTTLLMPAAKLGIDLLCKPITSDPFARALGGIGMKTYWDWY